jgi:hypothetical protein
VPRFSDKSLAGAALRRKLVLLIRTKLLVQKKTESVAFLVALLEAINFCLCAKVPTTILAVDDCGELARGCGDCFVCCADARLVVVIVAEKVNKKCAWLRVI